MLEQDKIGYFQEIEFSAYINIFFVVFMNAGFLQRHYRGTRQKLLKISLVDGTLQ